MDNSLGGHFQVEHRCWSRRQTQVLVKVDENRLLSHSTKVQMSHRLGTWSRSGSQEDQSTEQGPGVAHDWGKPVSRREVTFLFGKPTPCLPDACAPSSCSVRQAAKPSFLNSLGSRGALLHVGSVAPRLRIPRCSWKMPISRADCVPLEWNFGPSLGESWR